MALAGGVSLVLAPEHLIGICQMTALSADGRCKTFDANADGFGQGEGCGMVALKRLSDAQADGDPVLGLEHDLALSSRLEILGELHVLARAAADT